MVVKFIKRLEALDGLKGISLPKERDQEENKEVDKEEEEQKDFAENQTSNKIVQQLILKSNEIHETAETEVRKYLVDNMPRFIK